MSEQKTCSRCKEEKSCLEFPKNSAKPDGLHGWCKDCNSKAAKDKYQKARRGSEELYNYGRAYNLKRYYGLSVEQYEELLKKQDYRCAVCLKHQDECKHKFSVDHNHRTGEIRGLLCTYCNHRLVGRHTDGELLLRMAKYVSQGTGLFVPDDFRTGRRTNRKKKHAR